MKSLLLLVCLISFTTNARSSTQELEGREKSEPLIKYVHKRIFDTTPITPNERYKKNIFPKITEKYTISLNSSSSPSMNSTISAATKSPVMPEVNYKLSKTMFFSDKKSEDLQVSKHDVKFTRQGRQTLENNENKRTRANLVILQLFKKSIVDADATNESALVISEKKKMHRNGNRRPRSSSNEFKNISRPYRGVIYAYPEKNSKFSYSAQNSNVNEENVNKVTKNAGLKIVLIAQLRNMKQKRSLYIIEEENLSTTVSVFKFTGKDTQLSNDLTFKNINV